MVRNFIFIALTAWTLVLIHAEPISLPIRHVSVDSAKSNILATGGQGLAQKHGSFFVTEITVGMPAQKQQVFIDPSSSDSWFVSTSCEDYHCDVADTDFNRTKFNEKKSFTFQKTTKTFAYELEPPFTSGVYGKDIVNLATIRMDKQPIQLVTKGSLDLRMRPYDGLIGLKFPNVTDNSYPTVVETLISKLDKPLYTLWFSSLALPTGNTLPTGQLTLGAFDSQRCDLSTVVYTPAKLYPHWTIEMTEFRYGFWFLNGVPLSLESSTNNPYLYVDNRIFLYMQKKLNAYFDAKLAKNIVPCTAVKGAAKITFIVGGVELSLDASSYIFDVKLGNNKCVLGVSPLLNSKEWDFGQPLSRSYCIVYDFGQKQIGFAERKDKS